MRTGRCSGLQGLKRRSLGQLVHLVPLSQAVVLAARPIPLLHGFRTRNTVYSVVDVRVKDMGKCVLHPTPLKPGFGRELTHYFSKIFGASFLLPSDTQQRSDGLHFPPWLFAGLSAHLHNTSKDGGAVSLSGSYPVPA